MAKFDIALDEGRKNLETHLCSGEKGVAYLNGELFTIEKLSYSTYRAYYSSLKTGLIRASGNSIIEAINNVCFLRDRFDT